MAQLINNSHIINSFLKTPYTYPNKNLKITTAKSIDKATNTFINTYSNKFNAMDHVCMRRGKARPIENDNTPAGVAIGLVEMFAGLLLCIIPHPATIGIGAGIIADGARRIADAGEDLDQKNTNNGGWPAEIPRPIEKSPPPQ